MAEVGVAVRPPGAPGAIGSTTLDRRHAAADRERRDPQPGDRVDQRRPDRQRCVGVARRARRRVDQLGLAEAVGGVRWIGRDPDGDPGDSRRGRAEVVEVRSVDGAQVEVQPGPVAPVDPEQPVAPGRSVEDRSELVRAAGSDRPDLGLGQPAELPEVGRVVVLRGAAAHDRERVAVLRRGAARGDRDPDPGRAAAEAAGVVDPEVVAQLVGHHPQDEGAVVPALRPGHLRRGRPRHTRAPVGRRTRSW